MLLPKVYTITYFVIHIKVSAYMKMVISKRTSNIISSLNRLHREYIARNKNNNYSFMNIEGLYTDL